MREENVRRLAAITTYSFLTLLIIIPILTSYQPDPNSTTQTTVNSDMEQCTAVIVTGTAAKSGRAILMKNRDTGDTQNKPTYVAPTSEHYGYTMVNWVWMGINERGLAVMNTAVGALGFGGSGMDNGVLNRWILEHCETVSQVCYELNNTGGEVGPGKRLGGTCVGVVDRFGHGAFIEISGVGAYARFIVNDYDSEANHPRSYPGYASGPSGRDQYALDAMNVIKAQKGVISWEDVAQNVSRYVRYKEQGSLSFSIGGEIGNTGTQAAMVAVSGDQRYDGKLNCMWGEYGNPPLVGLFVPSIAYGGQPPSILNSFWNQVWQKRSFTQDIGGYYVPEKVREVQSYTFFAEDYTFWKYDELASTIPEGLSNLQLKTRLQEYVNYSVQFATQIYIAEPHVSQHTVTHEGNEYGITTVSDSLIYGFQASAGSNVEINFNITAPPGTSGSCYTKIPKTLWNGSFNITVGNDEHTINNPPPYGNSILLNFTYSQASQVTIAGSGSFPSWDTNQDGKVDMRDVSLVARAFGTTTGSPYWNQQADLNNDAVVDMSDMAIVARHFGEGFT
jgi:hypothetical protein